MGRFSGEFFLENDRELYLWRCSWETYLYMIEQANAGVGVCTGLVGIPGGISLVGRESKGKPKIKVIFGIGHSGRQRGVGPDSISQPISTG